MSGWNKPTEKPVETKKAAKPAFEHVLIASGVVAVLGCVLLLVFSGGDGAPKAKAEKKAGVIKEVKPAAAPKVAPAEEKKPNPNEETYRDAHGVLRYKIGNGRAFDPTMKVHKNTPTRDKNGKKRFGARYTIFETRAENEIAYLLCARPGAPRFGTRIYDAEFEAEFMKSCETPIIAEPGDSDYVKDLKKAVNEAKIEIRSRMAQGEKLADILGETSKELKRLAHYKRELQKQATEVLQSGTLSDQDAADLITAANKMLAEKGISPISKTALMMNHVKLSGETEQQGQTNEAGEK